MVLIDWDTFWSVFLAVSLAEFCRELYNRYAKDWINGILDGMEEKGKKEVERMKREFK